MTYGKIIPGLRIDGKEANYGVVNERSGRAAAGIMMMLGIVAVVFAFFMKEFLLLGVVVTAFAIEFALRIIQPGYNQIRPETILPKRFPKPEPFVEQNLIQANL